MENNGQLTPSQTTDLLRTLGHTPVKKFGQNFLVDANIVRKSLELADVNEGDSVVEVGPGMDYVPLLWIILAVERVEIVIEATFVAVAPENDGGVVHVAGNQRFHQFQSYFSTIGVLPSR